MPAYPYALTLANPGAETGDASGWTNDLGALTAATVAGGVSPHSGTYLFWSGPNASMRAHQDVAVPADLLADVDAGSLQATFAAWQAGWPGDADTGWLGLLFLDGSGSQLGAEASTAPYDGNDTWVQKSVTASIPAGTRTIRVKLYGTRVAGTNLDAYFDDCTLEAAVRPPSAPVVAQTDYATGGFIEAAVTYDGFGDQSGVHWKVYDLAGALLHDCGVETVNLVYRSFGAAESIVDGGEYLIGCAQQDSLGQWGAEGLGRAYAYAGAPTASADLYAWNRVAKVTGFADGAVFTGSVPDESAAGGHTLFPFTNKQPLYQNDASTGYPALDFNVTGYRDAGAGMAGVSITNPTALTVVLVVKLSNTVAELFQLVNSGASKRLNFFADGRYSDTDNGTKTPTAAPPTGQIVVLVWEVVEGVAVRQWTNGVEKLNAPIGALADVVFSSASLFRNVDLNNATGYFYELQLYTGQLETNFRRQIEDQLGTTYGVAITHPSAAPGQPGAYTNPVGPDNTEALVEGDTLAWGAATDSDGDLDHYELQWREWGGAGWQPLATPAGTSYTLTAADILAIGAGPNRYFRVRGVDATGLVGTWRESAKAEVDTTGAGAPGAPTITGVADSQTQITLTLGAGSGADDHELYRDGVLLETWIGAPPAEYVDAVPTEATDYVYQLVAINDGGSTSASATIHAPGYEPAPLARVGATTATTAQLLVPLSSPEVYSRIRFFVRRADTLALVYTGPWVTVGSDGFRDTATGLPSATALLASAQGEVLDPAGGLTDEGTRVPFASAAAPAYRPLPFLTPEVGDVLTASPATISWRPLLTGETAIVEVSNDFGATWSQVGGTFTDADTETDWTLPADGCYSLRLTGDLGTVYFTAGVLVNGSGTLTGDFAAQNGTIRDWTGWRQIGSGWATSYVRDSFADIDASASVLIPPDPPVALGIEAATNVMFGSPGGGSIFNSQFPWEFASGGIVCVGEERCVFVGLETYTAWGLGPCTYYGIMGCDFIVREFARADLPGFGNQGAALYRDSSFGPIYGNGNTNQTLDGESCFRRPYYPVTARVTHPDEGDHTTVRIQGYAVGEGGRVAEYDEIVTLGGAMGCMFAVIVSSQTSQGREGWREFSGMAGVAVQEGPCDVTIPGVQVPEAPPYYTVPRKPCALVLTKYEDDRITPEWVLTTDPDFTDGGALPYLKEPGRGQSQQIDPAACTATIGTVEVATIDPATIAGDQDSGWATDKLQDIAGSRCRLVRYTDEEHDPIVIADGPAGQPRMNETYAGYSWPIRDVRESERKLKAFVRGYVGGEWTTQVLPAGVRGGFGRRESGIFVVSPAGFNLGTFGTLAGGLAGLFNISGGVITDPADPRFVFGDAMRKAMTGETYNDGASARFPRVGIAWRPEGSTDPFTVLTRIRGPADVFPDNPGSAGSKTIAVPAAATLEDGSAASICSAVVIAFDGGDPGWSFPADGQTVEWYVFYLGVPTDDYPFHWEGAVGDLLMDGYDGLFASPVDSDGDGFGDTPPITGIRYDPAAFDPATVPAMATQVRLRLTEPADDFRKWAEENVYALLGYIPALDLDGRISPLPQAPPADTSGLIELANAITAPTPEWQHGERLVNDVEVTYKRVYHDPESTASDFLSEREVERIYRHEASIDRFGEQTLKIETDAFTALGDDAGEAEGSELGDTLAEARATHLIARYAHGTPYFTTKVFRPPTETLRAANFVTLDLSWYPDYPTRRRGRSGLGQLLVTDDLSCAWRRFTVEDVPDLTPPVEPPPATGPSVAGTGTFTPDGDICTTNQGTVHLEWTVTDPPASGYSIRIVEQFQDTGDTTWDVRQVVAGLDPALGVYEFLWTVPDPLGPHTSPLRLQYRIQLVRDADTLVVAEDAGAALLLLVPRDCS